jgi:xanthine dehydrogenase FAD-binding subunit
MLTCDSYHNPKSLAEAFATIGQNHGRYKLIAGATDLLPWAREGRAGDVHIPTLIDVSGLPELNRIHRSKDKMWIGGAVPFQRFIDHPDLVDTLPSMPEAAAWFADQQLRESATVGGNIMNASPAADGIPPLLVANARVELARWQGHKISSRLLALQDLLKGPGKIDAQEDEILVGVECDSLEGYGGAFEKVGHRRSLVISVACVAAAVRLDEAKQSFADVRLAVGGVGPVAMRMSALEKALCGRAIHPDELKSTLSLCDDFVQSRSRQAYRRHVLRAFVARALARAMAHAGVSDALCRACEGVCDE